MGQAPKRLPLSGSEPKFTQKMWGRAVGINNNNCYAYAVGDYEKKRSYKSVPGERAGIKNMNHSYVSCMKLPQRVIADNPKRVYMAKAEEKCKPGHYKVMMFIAPGKPTNYFRQGDFHFYKQVNEVEYKVKWKGWSMKMLWWPAVYVMLLAACMFLTKTRALSITCSRQKFLTTRVYCMHESWNQRNKRQ